MVNKHYVMKAGECLTRGLIIDMPWIGKILSGEKSWEMRSGNTKVRGPIALIQKGTGSVVGLARLIDSKGPLSFEEILDGEAFHRIGPELYSQPDYKWDHAWVLTDPWVLPKPVPYRHKNGAVIWVELDPNALDSINNSLSGCKAQVVRHMPLEQTIDSVIEEPQDVAKIAQPPATKKDHGALP